MNVLVRGRAFIPGGRGCEGRCEGEAGGQLHARSGFALPSSLGASIRRSSTRYRQCTAVRARSFHASVGCDSKRRGLVAALRPGSRCAPLSLHLRPQCLTPTLDRQTAGPHQVGPLQLHHHTCWCLPFDAGGNLQTGAVTAAGATHEPQCHQPAAHSRPAGACGARASRAKERSRAVHQRRAAGGGILSRVLARLAIPAGAWGGHLHRARGGGAAASAPGHNHTSNVHSQWT